MRPRFTISIDRVGSTVNNELNHIATTGKECFRKSIRGYSNTVVYERIWTNRTNDPTYYSTAVVSSAGLYPRLDRIRRQ